MTDNRTTELREKLTERGVKWWPMSDDNGEYSEDRDTEFVIDGKKYTYHEWGEWSSVHGVTPEQAIAATLDDDDYERKMDALLCRLTNGKFSKSRAYDLDFMESCVNEEYEELYEKERAELGSGTCEPKWTLQGETQTQEFWSCECGNCGECFGTEDRSSFPFKITVDKVDIPNFCPNCGREVVVE